MPNRAVAPPRKLTARQILFVHAYCANGQNAALAAREAGYSLKSADRLGYGQLQNPLVAARIRETLQRHAVRLDLTGDRVLQENARIAFSDIRRYVTWNHDGEATWRPSEDLTLDEAAAVKSFTVTKRYDKGTLVSTESKLDLHAKQPALDAIAKHLGLFRADNEQKGAATIADLVRAAALAGGPLVLEGEVVGHRD
jgi:phage terminase small subunit